MSGGEGTGSLRPPSTQSLMLTFSNPAAPEMEDEYHRWYSQVHIPQLLAHVPGLTAATRYRCGDGSPHRYLTVYQVEGSDRAVLQDLADRMADGTLDRSPALQRDPPPIMIFVDPIDDRGDPVAGPVHG